MQNKKIWYMSAVFALLVCGTARAAADTDIDAEMDQRSAQAVADYKVEGSLFQQITDLEQEKVLMQLLDLELDRLAAEKIKLHMEIDTLSGRAEAAQQELETEKAKLEAEAARLEREKASLEAAASAPASAATSASARVTEEKETGTIAENFRLINVIGAGSQLQATVEALDTGQTKRIRVGSVLDGFSVKSISLDDGVVFVKDGKSQTLNIGGNR